MEMRVAIIRAGMSGLVACKHLLQFGFKPVVFEADDGIGGLWTHTIESTKLQSTKQRYQFIDFPWLSSVKEDHPSHYQVVDYFNSYAQHFSLIPHIKFNSKVIDIDYVSGESIEEMKSWELWGGNGRPFGSKGTSHITVQHTKKLSIKWKLPLKKYGMVPNHSILQDLSTCLFGVFSNNFFDKLKEGSILIKE
ncbi:hypothetical protein VNO78_03094 [Psophocarpus tetragonolobus]|uniref:Flavin-containing monooxygenase n=1 Tax=Psophocarpus tetragonolobus TaxID=3891 RepID=A0AAN9XWN4_PSOTE